MNKDDYNIKGKWTKTLEVTNIFLIAMIIINILLRIFFITNIMTETQNYIVVSYYIGALIMLCILFGIIKKKAIYYAGLTIWLGFSVMRHLLEGDIKTDIFSLIHLLFFILIPIVSFIIWKQVFHLKIKK